MTRGRKCQYESNENIYGIYTQSGYRYGFCVKCCKWAKAKNWHLHVHPDWEKEAGEQINIQALDELIDECAKLVVSLGK